MGVDIEPIDPSERGEWDRYVTRSRAGTLFHQYDVLELIEKYASARLHTLIGRKGQEPVGIFPVFEVKKGGISTAFSPPPRLGIPFLGPAPITNQQMKRRKTERQQRRFVEGCLDWIAEEVGPRYYRICTPIEFDDPRPFTWNDYETTPLHTYLLDIDTDLETLKKSFSKSLRRYLDPEDERRFTIEERGTDGIRFIYDHICARYEAQDKTYSVPLDYLLELYERLPDGSVRPYVGTVDGEQVSGIIILEGDSTIFYSEGGGRPDVDFPINDLTHWKIIESARERGIETYDLGGANTPRICDYKSKFNPALATYYEIEKGTIDMKIASNVYRKLR